MFRDGRILVVDDYNSTADAVAKALSYLGYETRPAHDGQSALAVAREFEPDLVLLDIGLPDMDGYEVAARLCASGRTPILVAVTGHTALDETRADFREHVVKPIDVEALEALVLRLLPH